MARRAATLSVPRLGSRLAVCRAAAALVILPWKLFAAATLGMTANTNAATASPATSVRRGRRRTATRATGPLMSCPLLGCITGNQDRRLSAPRHRRSRQSWSPVLAPGLTIGWMATPEPERMSGALIGREREHAAIDRLLDASAQGESSCLVLRGEA